MPSVHFKKKPAELVDLKPETQIRVEGYCTEGCEGSWVFFFSLLFLISKSHNWAGDAVAEKSRMAYS